MKDVRIPLNGTFELTARCNLHCRMCLIRIDEKRLTELGGSERTAGEWIAMAREVMEAGTVSLLLTGGEPLLRPDFADIYLALARMGFILTLYTNATLLTPGVYQALEKFPPHRIGVTVYGASPETYGKVTGSAKAFIQMREGVALLKELPSKLSVRTTIIQDNRMDLPEIGQWVRGLGPKVRFDLSRIVTKPIRGGAADVEGCRLTPEENAAMIRERNMELLVAPFRRFLEGEPSGQFPQEAWQYLKETESLTTDAVPRQTLYGCEAGMNSYTITWDGRLIGCQMLEDCWTYPFENGFLSAWEEFPEHVTLPPLPKQCVGCEIRCCACPATRLAETGSLSGWPDYLCRESKLTNAMEKEIASELEKIAEEGMKNASLRIAKGDLPAADAV